MHFAILQPLEHTEFMSYKCQSIHQYEERDRMSIYFVINTSNKPDSWIIHGPKDPQSSSHLLKQIFSLLWSEYVFSFFPYQQECESEVDLLYQYLYHSGSSFHCVLAGSLYFQIIKKSVNNLCSKITAGIKIIHAISSARQTIRSASSMLQLEGAIIMCFMVSNFK